MKYDDRQPWPVGADGYSSSLERISPSAKSSAAWNWAPSPLPLGERRPTGTPGRQNVNYSANLPPIISEVKFSPNTPTPSQPVTVEAKVKDADGIGEVVLLYRVAKSGFEGADLQVPMKRVWGDEKSGRYSSVIPGHPSGQLVRFRIQAIDATPMDRGRLGATRFQPHPNEPRPTYSYFTYASQETTTIPLGFILHVEKEASQAALRALDHREPNTELERWLAEEILRAGMNLEAAWSFLLTTQELSATQICELLEIFRDKFEAREKEIKRVMRSESLFEETKKSPALIFAFNASLLDMVKTVLTEEQHESFVRWHKGYLFSMIMSGKKWGAEQYLKRSVDLEGSFFFLSLMPDLHDSQFAQLKPIYQKALKARRELISAAKRVENDNQKQWDFFSTGWKLNDSLSETLKTVLTDSQYEAFCLWGAEHGIFRNLARPSPKPPPEPRGKSAFVYVSPAGNYALYDYIHVTFRPGGYKVRFHKDVPLSLSPHGNREFLTINLVSEPSLRFLLTESLAYELYRRAGVPAPLTEYVRVFVDDRLLGYHLLIEQPNRTFLSRNGRNDSGNLYKLIWYEHGVVGQYEKKTNRNTGHDDIVALVEALEKTEGEQQWQLIKRHFNVEEAINHFAVNMCLSNWDGFFNNYFTFQ